MALFVIVFSSNMFDKMTETINNAKPIKKLYFFIFQIILRFYYLLISAAKVLILNNTKC